MTYHVHFTGLSTYRRRSFNTKRGAVEAAQVWCDRTGKAASICHKGERGDRVRYWFDREGLQHMEF